VKDDGTKTGGLTVQITVRLEKFDREMVVQSDCIGELKLHLPKGAGIVRFQGQLLAMEFDHDLIRLSAIVIGKPVVTPGE
jgi:hypothetical protein